MRFILALILIIGVAVSLHDIDKTNSNRITPILNSADDVSQRMAQGTNGVQNTNDLDEVDGLQFRERQIVAVQDGENKAAFGFYGAANKFGLKVAQDGFDVLTAADDELIFNSEQNTFKIVKIVYTTLADFSLTTGAGVWADTTVTTDTAHELSYIPIPVSFYQAGGGTYQPLPYVAMNTVGGAPYWYQIRVEVTGTNVKVKETAVGYNTTFSTGGTRVIKTYLLQETAD